MSNNLTARSLRTLRNIRHSLVSLSLYGCPFIFRKSTDVDEDDDTEDEYYDTTKFTFQGFRRLCVLNLGDLPLEMDVEALLKPLECIRALDLSSSILPRPAFLTQWRDQLTSLVLYNVDVNEELLATVLSLSRLRYTACKLAATTTTLFFG